MPRGSGTKYDKTLLGGRLDPREPYFAPVAVDLRSRVYLNLYLLWWGARVRQKRVKLFGFVSLSRSRRFHARKRP